MHWHAGMHLATAGRDRMVTIWNVRRRKQIATRRANAIMSDLAWEPNAARVVCIGEDGSLFEWQHALPAGLMERSSPLDELADCAGDDDDDNGLPHVRPPVRTYSFDLGAHVASCSHA